MEVRNALNSMGLNKTSRITVIIFVILITGGNMWWNRNAPALGYKRYSKYGFSVDYNQVMILEEVDLTTATSYEMGAIVGRVQSDFLEQFGVFWLLPEILPSHFQDNMLEGSIEYLLGMAGLSGTMFSDQSEYYYSKKNGKNMVYQYLNITEPELDIPIIIGAWQCDDKRIFALYYLYVKDFESITYSRETLKSRWTKYLNSFACASE